MIAQIIKKYEKARANIDPLGFAKYDVVWTKKLNLATILNAKENIENTLMSTSGEIKCYSCGRSGQYANRCMFKRKVKAGERD